jgi:hypothetical protein
MRPNLTRECAGEGPDALVDLSLAQLCGFSYTPNSGSRTQDHVT